MSHASEQMVYLDTVGRPSKTVRTGLYPQIAEILLVAALVAYYLIAGAAVDEADLPSVNLIGSAALTAVLIANASAMVKHDGRILWTALFWFRMSTAVYFGFGSFIVYLVGDVSRTRLEGFYQFTDVEIWKLNLLIAVSVLLVLVFARLGISVYRRIVSPRLQRPKPVVSSGIGMLVAALIFLIVGLTVNYAIVVPYRMGLTSTVSAGIFSKFAQFIPIGVFLITLWSLRHAKSLLLFILFLIGVEMTLSIMMFMKSAMLMMLIMVALAFLWDKVTIKKLVTFGGLVIFTYAVISPVISDARHEIGLRYGANTQAGFAERFEILQLSLTGEASSDDSDGLRGGGLLRLSYANASTFVIQLYDTGNPSDWPTLLPAVFVPRIFWPEKPIISDIGLDIYELSTGRRSSSSGVGLFPEAYWAMGWAGIFIFVPVYGFIIGFLTNAAMDILRDENWLFAPVVLMALYMGFRTDGHYITDVAGSSVILVFLYIGLRILSALMKLFFGSLNHSPVRY